MGWPKIAAGDLRHRVALMAPPEPQGRDSRGEAADQDSVLAEVWALVEELSGHKLVVAQALASEQTHTVTIRWRPGLDPLQWVSYRGRRLNLVAPPRNPDGKLIWLELTCAEGVS